MRKYIFLVLLIGLVFLTSNCCLVREGNSTDNLDNPAPALFSKTIIEIYSSPQNKYIYLVGDIKYSNENEVKFISGFNMSPYTNKLEIAYIKSHYFSWKKENYNNSLCIFFPPHFTGKQLN